MRTRQCIKYTNVARKFILSATVGTCATHCIATRHVTNCLCGSVCHQRLLNHTANFHEAYRYRLLHNHTLSHFLYTTNKLGAAVIDGKSNTNVMQRTALTTCTITDLKREISIVTQAYVTQKSQMTSITYQKFVTTCSTS
jgi:hypothetical protein